MFESGVKKYVFVRVNYEFGFPVTFHDVAHVECAYCQMYDKYKNRCNITGEYQPVMWALNARWNW